MNSERLFRIAVDAMGGDFAPDNQVIGSIEAAKSNERIEVILVGKEKILYDLLYKYKGNTNNIKIANASDIVTMEDLPSEVYKSKPDSSLNVALQMQKENKADALISAGNTGAILSHSTLKLGRLKGVSRPTIGSIFPTEKNITMVFDVGATVDCRPIHLKEYAIMGSVYMKEILGIENPRVGLLSVGEEKNKGSELTLEAYKLLERTKLNFIGNIEGRDILNGYVDVVVCDGFVGNIILKFAESVLGLMKAKMKEYAEKGFFHKLWAGAFSGTLKKVLKEFDYQYYGGVPLLGINGVSIVGHGKSSPLAIKNMINRAMEVVYKQVPQKIEKRINLIDN